MVTALVLMGTAVGEISRTGLVGEWHFEGDVKDSSGNYGDLSFAKDYEIIIFGSYASKTADKRSDIDIAIITREHDRQKCIEIWRGTFGNRLDISEYFYGYRKLWNDVKHRIETNRFSSMREKLIVLKPAFPTSSYN